MLPAASFSCSFTGTCSGSPIFGQLQREMNRVRPIYGLPADVSVDGKIGIKTLAKMIKTAQAISRRLGESFDDVALSDYAYPDIAGNITTKMMAFEADVLLASLRRNGYAVGRVPPGVAAQSLIDPYLVNANASPPIPPKSALPQIGPLVVNVGPTAPAPTTQPPPTFLPSSGIPIGVKIAGGVFLGLGIVGGIAAAVMGFRNR